MIFFSVNLLNRFSFKTFPQFMGAPLLLLLLPSVHCVRVNCSITDHLYHPPRISSTKVLSKSTILQILALLPVSSRASRVIDMKAKNIYFFPFVCQCNSSIDQYTLQENGKKKGRNGIYMNISSFCIYLLSAYQSHTTFVYLKTLRIR